MTEAGTSRRRFIQGGLLFGAAAFGLYHGWGRRPVARPDPEHTAGALATSQYRTLEAAFVELLDDPAAGRFAAIQLNSFLAEDADQAAQLGLGLTLLEMAPGGLGTATRFTRMDRTARADVLRAWQGSSLGVRRQIHQALRQACRFIHFSQPERWAEIGYDGPWVGA